MFARVSLPVQLVVGLLLLYVVYHFGTMLPASPSALKALRPVPDKQEEVKKPEAKAVVAPPLVPSVAASSELSLGDKADTDWLRDVMQRERENIAKTLKDYPFKDGDSPESLIYEKGGNPIKALISTTWRSGSTFLGDILLSHPATFYHYEPLLHFQIKQARHGHLAEEGVRVIRQLMKCDYSNLDSYYEYGCRHHELFRHNVRYWKFCKGKGTSMCWRPKVTENMCKLYPFQSIKTVRLRINLTGEFLQDDSLNVKVLLLVRDPRGTLQSRLHRVWCPGRDDCDKPQNLCSDLVSDFHAAKILLKEFPDKFAVYRYEDFADNPSVHSTKLLSFFGFQMHPQVKAFITSHTKSNVGGVSSTFRDSKTAPYHWKNDLPFSEIKKIQGECDEALKLWGYHSYTSEGQLNEVHPVRNFTIVAAP